MKLELYYPAKPYKINQVWGTYHPEIYSQFGFTEHNGVDIALGDDKLVYAPANGKIVKQANQPNGGGNYVGFLLDDVYTFDDGVSCHVLVDFLHLDHFIAPVNVSLPLGTVIAMADNTGFSTGPHTHCQYRRGEWNGAVFTPRDSNQANNSFDPVPYFNGKYASDVKEKLPQHFTNFQKALNDFQLAESIQPFELVGKLSKTALNKYLTKNKYVI